MCRGFQQNERERLKIKAFYIRLSALNALKPLPYSLTLCYLPRINGSPLEINETEIRPDSPAFVTLYRVISAETATKGAIFGSRECVRASEGVRFEVYLRDEKVLKGIFRKDEGNEWILDCKCVLESELVGVEVKEAEVCVAVEGQVAMSEKVEMVVKRKRRPKCFQGLEDIPEEREVECDSDACCCCCSGEEGNEIGSDGGDCAEEEEEESDEDREGTEMKMEGVSWAVDVGIWVMCFGVGYLIL
ncbi:hypothetical protein F0562_007606 [Nyssa sinensis]|uniref:Uncharacterized protein n=1 Tax=Nyssa sinensis TaxID=561372 RepID=A0A5J5A4D0_9ASTE|nr:hypothetical protein F0562_007606 [Nyssa sinensis]